MLATSSDQAVVTGEKTEGAETEPATPSADEPAKAEAAAPSAEVRAERQPDPEDNVRGPCAPKCDDARAPEASCVFLLPQCGSGPVLGNGNSSKPWTST